MPDWTNLPRRRPLAALLAAALAAGAPGMASAFSLPGAGAPLPSPRPDAFSLMDRAEAGVPLSAGDIAAEASPLASGLDALARAEIAAARALRDGLPAGTLDRAILTWALALGGYSEVTSSEIADAADELAGWPGRETLRRNSERAVAREAPGAQAVVDAFGATAPLTLEGALMLARAHRMLGDDDAARTTLAPFWRTTRLDAAAELPLIAEFGTLLPPALHRARMEQMLHEERIASALRVASLAQAEELARAWAAAIREAPDTLDLLDAVPEAQRGAGYHFAKARFLRRKGRYPEAADAMLAAPTAAGTLVDPDAWWVERRVLSREMLDIDRPDLAYAIAAAHAAESPAMAADAEFHAGWYALRFLGEPQKAHAHFARIAEFASGAISQARAHYWMGRAIEAGAAGDATAAFETAAAFGTVFYGQLAAAELGRGRIETGRPQPTEADRAAFAGRPAVAAIRRLEEVGHGWRADVLYRDLAEELSSAGELALLADMAEARGDLTLALRVGKIGARRGMDVGALAHPVGAIPDTADISGAGKALAYAIARQESEFNPAAVSGAGARGLLQLLPGTARDMARHAGLAYSASRLTSDAGYNATLGAAFLAKQLDRFDGSYVLTFVGYNAGPGRARDWVERYGDPRGRPIEEVVDWVERIPFTETRNYVQRVMENYQVYKMRLTGQSDIASDLVQGR